jgi:hypothetical protein
MEWKTLLLNSPPLNGQGIGHNRYQMNENDKEDDALKSAENGVADVEMDLQQSEKKRNIIYNEDDKEDDSII